MSELAIELKGIDKSFGLVHANRNINLKVRKGTIHGIIGENGAGKSTLMSILYGFYQADHGDILIAGSKVDIRDPNAAIAAGGVKRVDEAPQTESLREALITRDRRTVYRVDDGIPVLLIEEGIATASVPGL
jgi:ABC-type sugar transport system ATPase subunit